MKIVLHFSEAIENRRKNIAALALDRAEARMAERAAAAEVADLTDYKPRRWFPTEDVRQLAKVRDRAEQESVKRATGVRPYNFHETEDARLAAIRESNRLASQKARDKRAAAAKEVRS